MTKHPVNLAWRGNCATSHRWESVCEPHQSESSLSQKAIREEGARKHGIGPHPVTQKPTLPPAQTVVIYSLPCPGHVNNCHLNCLLSLGSKFQGACEFLCGKGDERVSGTLRRLDQRIDHVTNVLAPVSPESAPRVVLCVGKVVSNCDFILYTSTI